MDINTINSVNTLLSILIVAGSVVWLIRFSSSYIIHRDSVGLFLVFWALSLMIQNVFTLSLQASSALEAFSGGMHVSVFVARVIERVINIVLLAGMFYLARSDE